MNSLIVEQIICLQIKIYSVIKSYGPGGERIRPQGIGIECPVLCFVIMLRCFAIFHKRRMNE